jgi:hypothetical protein
LKKEKPKEIILELEKVMGANFETRSGVSEAILRTIESQPEEKQLSMLKLVITNYSLVPENDELIPENKMDDKQWHRLTNQMIDEIIEFNAQVVHSGKSEDEVAGMLMEKLKGKATLDERIVFLSHIISGDHTFVPYIPFKLECTIFTSDEINMAFSKDSTLKRKAVLIEKIITNPLFNRDKKGSEIIAAVTQIIDSESELVNRQVLISAMFSAFINYLSVSSSMPDVLGILLGLGEQLKAMKEGEAMNKGENPKDKVSTSFPGFFISGKGGKKDH